MTHRTRNILFLSLLILFLIAAPVTVFYSLGWRFDWQTKRIVQTGVFYFKAWPKSTQIYINEKAKEKTDLFFGSVLIENLLPGKYQIEIKKEKYHDWKKTLEIKKRGVTEAKNIILIPKEFSFNILTKEVKEFYFFPDGKKIILEQEDGLKLFELKTNLKSHLINITNIIDIKFSPDSKMVLLQTQGKKKIQYYILDIDKSPAVLIHLNFLDSVEKIYFHPKNPEKLLVLLSLNTLNEVDFIDKEILSPLFENVITFSIFNKNIYYLDNSGFFFREEERLNIIPFEIKIKKETKYEIIVSNSHIFLREDNILYIFNESKKSFQKFFEPIKDIKFSSGSRKAAYYNNHEIWVLFLEKQYDQPVKELGEQLFITRFSEKIDNLFWYTNHYLIFNIGNRIKIVEIDDRDKINIYDLIEFKNPEIFWANKKLYILSEQTFYVSDELTP